MTLRGIIMLIDAMCMSTYALSADHILTIYTEDILM